MKKLFVLAALLLSSIVAASTLYTPSPGYSALAQRKTRPLATSQVFNPSAVVGLDASGNATPFLSGTVSGVQYAIGLLDQSMVGSSSFTSTSGQTAPVLSGIISLANGTSGNAIGQSNTGAAVYTADGLTANLTSGSNPKVGGGTTTGKLLGTVLGLDSAISGNVLVSVIPEINAALSSGGGGGTVNCAAGQYLMGSNSGTVCTNAPFLDGGEMINGYVLATQALISSTLIAGTPPDGGGSPTINGSVQTEYLLVTGSPNKGCCVSDGGAACSGIQVQAGAIMLCQDVTNPDGGCLPIVDGGYLAMVGTRPGDLECYVGF